MSDLRPTGVTVELGGEEYTLLFTINAIDEIQAQCNMPLNDVVGYVANAADGATDHETLTVYKTLLSVLLCSGGADVTPDEVGDMLNLKNCRDIAFAVLRAYGVSTPEPDEDEDEDEDEEDDESPNVETGR